jgi:hypothetical protein
MFSIKAQVILASAGNAFQSVRPSLFLPCCSWIYCGLFHSAAGIKSVDRNFTDTIIRINLASAIEFTADPSDRAV